MFILKLVSIRLKESTIDWIENMAKKEKDPTGKTTMIRLFLEREQYKDETKKQFDKKKRGNK